MFNMFVVSRAACGCPSGCSGLASGEVCALGGSGRRPLTSMASIAPVRRRRRTRGCRRRQIVLHGAPPLCPRPPSKCGTRFILRKHFLFFTWPTAFVHRFRRLVIHHFTKAFSLLHLAHSFCHMSIPSPGDSSHCNARKNSKKQEERQEVQCLWMNITVRSILGRIKIANCLFIMYGHS